MRLRSLITFALTVMAPRQSHSTGVACAWIARLGACLLAIACAPLRADVDEETLVTPPPEFAERDLVDVPDNDRGPSDEKFLDPDAANFDTWEPLVDEHVGAFGGEKAQLRPFDWMRHWGFRHSSTDGRHTDRGVPLEYSSWLNRPYHVDWFLGPLLADNPAGDRVSQTNELLGGLRLGWDFDYYWGLEWRFAWADPNLVSVSDIEVQSGRYFASDVDLLYYPWGDTKVRPYFLLGLGLNEIDTVRDETGLTQQVTLLGMPLGVGVLFPQTHWLAWRLEILDNLAFGNDGVDTMNNISFTAGMELRMGARPNSYWPWRSSRNIW